MEMCEKRGMLELTEQHTEVWRTHRQKKTNRKIYTRTDIGVDEWIGGADV